MKKHIKKIIFFFIIIFSFCMPKNIKIEETLPETKEESLKHEISIDPKIYDELQLKSLFIKNEQEEKISWYYKEDEKSYYLFLPEAFKDNTTLLFDCRVKTYLSIYDSNDTLIKKITNNESIALEEEEYTFKLETNVKKTSTYKVKVKRSNLPSIFIDIEGGEESFKKIIEDEKHETGYKGEAKINDSQNNTTTGAIKKIRGRGNATWQREKKPFQINFEEKIAVLGMKKSKTWLLLNNYPDGSLSRNALWYQLAKEMDMPYSVEFEPIDLYINNEYQGNYLVTSKVEVEENRVNLGLDDVLIEIDDHDSLEQLTLNSERKFEIHYPNLEDFTKENKKKVEENVTKYLKKVDELIKNPKTTTEELTQYIDLESFAKYYWMQEISLNMDATINSFYLYIKDGILYAGPVWDMDATMNRSYLYTKTKGYYLTEDTYLYQRKRKNWYRELIKREDFSKKVDEIFLEYLEVFEKLPVYLENYVNQIKQSATMNYKRWPYENMMKKQGQKWRPNDKSLETSVALLKEDIKTRLNWYKQEYNLYDSFRMKEYQNETFLKETDITRNQTIKLDAKTTRIELYGLKEEKNEKLKEQTVLEQTTHLELTLNKKTTSKYKKSNQSIYHFTLKKEE